MTRQDDALAYVRSELGLSEAETEGWTTPGNLPAPPDLVLRRGEEVYVIELKTGRADLRSVGQLCFYRDLIARSEGLGENKIRIVLAAKAVPEGVREALEGVGGSTVRLPPDLELPQDQASIPLGKTQVTTPKAWRVVCTLLARPAPSINQLHEDSEVSYGWTHRTVKNLEELGVLGRDSGLLTLTDRSKLLNGVAWERPFDSLKTRELATDFESVERGGRELTRALGRSGTTFAFTAHTAAALHTGYAFRSDAFYLYVDDPDLVPDLVEEGDGPKLFLYEPDRPLERTELVEDVRLASRCQVLLDLAGMGPKAADMTRAMVEDLA